MASKKSLNWHEIRPGVFEREIDDAEIFYHNIAKHWAGTGHTYFAITAAIGLEVPFPENETVEEVRARILSALRCSWKAVRLEHPTLAARVEFNPQTKKLKKVYRALKTIADLDDWESGTFRLVSETQSGDQFADTDPVVDPEPTLYILEPASQEESRMNGVIGIDIVFRCGHEIIDGIGTLKLLNDIVKYTAEAYNSHYQPDFSIPIGQEYQNLSLPLEHGAALPPSPSSKQLDKLNAIQAVNRKAREFVELLGVPITLKTNMPLRSQRTAIELSASETANILSKCKASGVTPTHLFHAGIALALRDIQPRQEQERKGRYITYALINLRGICDPKPGPDRHVASVRHAVSAKHLVVDLNIPAQSAPAASTDKDELLRVLKQMKEFYQGNILDEDFLAVVPLLFKAGTPVYAENTPEVPPPNPTPTVSLSSLGAIEKCISPDRAPFKIRDPWVMGAEYSSGLGLFLGTWDRRISLSAGYNEAFHERSAVRDILERVRCAVLEIVERMG